MTEEQEHTWLREQRHHEAEIDRLAHALEQAGAVSCPRPDLLLFAAQMIRHRISVALLAARLAAK